MKSRCPECSEYVTVRGDAKLRIHGYELGAPDKFCVGSMTEVPSVPDQPTYIRRCEADSCSESTHAIVFDRFGKAWMSYCSRHAALQLAANMNTSED